MIRSDELEALKKIFNSCKYLESIEFCASYHPSFDFLYGKEFFEVITKYSSETLYEFTFDISHLSSGVLKKFLIDWGNRAQQKSLYFIIIGNRYKSDYIDFIKIFQKYKKVGVIKKIKFL